MMSLVPINSSNISPSTGNEYNDSHLVTSYGLIIVKCGQSYNDQQKRELPGLLFEFYVDNGNERFYLENMNKIWTVNNNQPVMLVNMPTDVKIRIVPLFDLSYISTLENPSSDFDIRVYIDPDIVIGGVNLESIYPIGSIWSATDDTDPNNVFDFGEWTLLDEVDVWEHVLNRTWEDIGKGDWDQFVSLSVRTIYVWQRTA